ncbi:small ribosomal subunit protein uS12m [Culicoides brevitarsis]|uniref:small ribosomal subunit protein uS12m n=1 Tax=Culicoides brevitarsis TaxID=469753 RepID=UPI00307B7E76
MNFLRQTMGFVTRNISRLATTPTSSALEVFKPSSAQLSLTNLVMRSMSTLSQMHRSGPHFKKRIKKRPLDGKPFAKGVVLKTLVKKPKKPNSANRKCVLVRLTTGKEMVAYVPGEGHNLQEHNIVLVRCGRLQDVPGVKLKCVRGKYDLGHVIKTK